MKYKSFKLYAGKFALLPPSDKVLLSIFAVVLCIYFFVILTILNNFFLLRTPVQYGTLTGGSVSVSQYRNPLFASSPIEKDIANINHASLFDYADGLLEKDLASSIQTVEDRTVEITINPTAVFHDGTPVTTTDVLHTIQMTDTADRDNQFIDMWDGFKLQAVDDKTFRVTVPKDALHYPHILTMPILPKRVWSKVSEAEYKTYKSSGSSIGAGPYKLAKEYLDLDGNTEKIQFIAFNKYIKGRPYIQHIQFILYNSQSDLKAAFISGEIDSIHSISSIEVASLLQYSEKPVRLYQFQGGRVFGIFYNTKDGKILSDPFLRGVLSQHLNREKIVEEILNTHASQLYHPLPSDLTAKKEINSVEELRQALDYVGWDFEGSSGKRKKDGEAFTITLAYPELEELTQTAEMIVEVWRSFGVEVDLQSVDPAEMQNYMAEGDFDAVLYGYEAYTVEDLVKVWEAGDTDNLASRIAYGSPALNDALQEVKERRIDGLPVSEELYEKVRDGIEEGFPAVFLYSPKLLYILRKDIRNVQELYVRDVSDRFINVHSWYIREERVWKFLFEYFDR